jgi:MraZ protein
MTALEGAHLFSGNALGAVDASGRVRLPLFILKELEARPQRCRFFFGAHERDPCVTGYEPAERAALCEEVERRRRLDEAEGRPPERHYARSRRLFGMVEEAPCDSRGRIALPPLARRRGRIGQLALFIGTGKSFEIWNPEVAMEASDPELRDVARYRLAEWQDGRNEDGETKHVD